MRPPEPPLTNPFAQSPDMEHLEHMPEPSDLIAMLVFSIIGLIVFRAAKREAQPVRLVIGMVLMLYPYFVPGGWWLWVAGILLTGTLFVFRE